MNRYVKRMLVFLFVAVFLAAAGIGFIPPASIYQIVKGSSALADSITNLTGITGKIGKEDVDWGTGQDTDTFSVTSSSGGSITLTKMPSLWANVASLIKGKWYVSNSASITNHSTASVQGSLAWVAATVGSDSVTVEIPAGAYAVGSDLTIPSNVALKVQNGALLTVASGKTLTINGPFSAGLYQVFSGSGSVEFAIGSVAEMNLEWWGGLPDGSTNCQTALTAAVAAMPASYGGTIRLASGIYMIDGLNITQAGVRIVGSGIETTKLKSTATINMQLLNLKGEHSYLADMTMDHNATGGSMPPPTSGDGAEILWIQSSHSKIERIRFIDPYNCFVVVMGKAAGEGIEDVTIKNCEFINEEVTTQGYDGVQVYGGDRTARNVRIEDCYFENTIRAGVNLDTNVIGVEVIGCRFHHTNFDDQPYGSYALLTNGGPDGVVFRDNDVYGAKVAVFARMGVGQLVVSGNVLRYLHSAAVEIYGYSAKYGDPTFMEAEWATGTRQTRTYNSLTYDVICRNLVVRDNDVYFSGTLTDTSTAGMVSLVGVNGGYDSSYYSAIDRVLIEGNSARGSGTNLAQFVYLGLTAADMALDIQIRNNNVVNGFDKVFVAASHLGPNRLIVSENTLQRISAATIFDSACELRVENNSWHQFRYGLTTGSIAVIDAPIAWFTGNIIHAQDSNHTTTITATGNATDYLVIKNNAVSDGTAVGLHPTSTPRPIMDWFTEHTGSAYEDYFLWVNAHSGSLMLKATAPPTTYSDGYYIPITLIGSASWNPGSIADGDEAVTDVTVTGAALGDYAVASFSVDTADLAISASVTATNTVTVSLLNNTGGAIDLASGTVRVVVVKK